MPVDPTTIPDNIDTIADDETKDKAERLGSLAKRLTKVQARLEKVLSKVGQPTDPGITSAERAEIKNINTAAALIVTTTQPYIGTIPTPPPDA